MSILDLKSAPNVNHQIMFGLKSPKPNLDYVFISKNLKTGRHGALKLDISTFVNISLTYMQYLGHSFFVIICTIRIYSFWIVGYFSMPLENVIIRSCCCYRVK